MVCVNVHAASCDLSSQETSKRLSQMVVSPSIRVEVQAEHSNIDGPLDAPGGPVIFPVEGLCTLHGDLVAWYPIKVQVL